MRSTSVERELRREHGDNDVPRLHTAPEVTPAQISDLVHVHHDDDHDDENRTVM